MARSHLTLAALATSAVAELEVVGAQSFGSRGGDFDAAILTGRDGRHWIVRVPRSERAEQEQSADLLALRALSAGVRARLPFTVSTFAGQVPVDGTRAVVSEFVYGSKVPLGSMGDVLAASIGRAIAAIHSLPPTVVVDAGLPSQSPVEALRAVVSVMDRAASTGLVPAALLARWERASEEPTLWQFTPTVVNGSLGSDSFLSANDEVTGMIGWHALRVGDPAADLQWLAGSGLEVVDAAFAAYASARGTVDRQLRTRAALLSELEVARWLLHGTETRDTSIVDDAVEMMSAIVDDVQRDLMSPLAERSTGPLDVDQVEDLLERTSRIR